MVAWSCGLLTALRNDAEEVGSGEGLAVAVVLVEVTDFSDSVVLGALGEVGGVAVFHIVCVLFLFCSTYNRGAIN